jgi:serine/threonine protein kinase
MNLLTRPNSPPALPQHESPHGPDMRKVSSKKQNSRKLWWQKSVVRRSMSSIEPDFEEVSSRSPFLQKHAHDDKCRKGIALFHRSEIQTGELLGKGGFSHVFEITAFQLESEISGRCTPQEQELRERYARTVFENDCYRYCIKHLQERLIQSPKDFQCAASDLAVEAAFMSALSHENILSIRGLPVDGLNAWEGGQHDGYFIIMDRLFGTLDKRIQEWQTIRPPSIQERTEYAFQLASALKFLHENRIVFRDLKPHNIGFTAENKIKL